MHQSYPMQVTAENPKYIKRKERRYIGYLAYTQTRTTVFTCIYIKKRSISYTPLVYMHCLHVYGGFYSFIIFFLKK